MKPLVLLCVLLFCGCANLQKQETSSLKLRHAQLVEALSVSHFNVSFGPFGGGDGGRQGKIDEKERIERELLRRYKGGEEGAYLAIFGR